MIYRDGRFVPNYSSRVPLFSAFCESAYFCGVLTLDDASQSYGDRRGLEASYASNLHVCEKISALLRSSVPRPPPGFFVARNARSGLVNKKKKR